MRVSAVNVRGGRPYACRHRRQVHVSTHMYVRVSAVRMLGGRPSACRHRRQAHVSTHVCMRVSAELAWRAAICMQAQATGVAVQSVTCHVYVDGCRENLVSSVGQNHIYMELLVEKSPYIWSYTVYICGSGQPYLFA